MSRKDKIYRVAIVSLEKDFSTYYTMGLTGEPTETLTEEGEDALMDVKEAGQVWTYISDHPNGFMGCYGVTDGRLEWQENVDGVFVDTEILDAIDRMKHL